MILIPADGGAEEGTRADIEPVFTTITREYELHVKVRVDLAYNAVVEGMVNAKVDVAFFVPLTFHQAKRRGISGGATPLFDTRVVKFHRYNCCLKDAAWSAGVDALKSATPALRVALGQPPVADDACPCVVSTDLQQRGLQFRWMLWCVRMAGTWT